MNRFNTEIITDLEREDAQYLYNIYNKPGGLQQACMELAMALAAHQNLQRKIADYRKQLRLQIEAKNASPRPSQLFKQFSKLYPSDSGTSTPQIREEDHLVSLEEMQVGKKKSQPKLTTQQIQNIGDHLKIPTEQIAVNDWEAYRDKEQPK